MTFFIVFMINSFVGTMIFDVFKELAFEIFIELLDTRGQNNTTACMLHIINGLLS